MTKGKDKARRPQPPRFLVGMDERPVRYSMTDETFEQVREQLFESLGNDIVSVDLLDDETLQIVKRAEAPQDRLIHQLGELVIKFDFSNPTVIVSEKG